MTYSNQLDELGIERYLAKYPHCLVVVSHSQDFLDGVCTQIMHLTIDGAQRGVAGFRGFLGRLHSVSGVLSKVA